jgi:DNA-binding transcriptional MerR regulator
VRIGELAARVGVNPKTVRYYEGIELLPEPPRTPSGYRDYGEQDVARLVFIKTAQRLNVSLDEIREILRIGERGERPCDYVLTVLTRQVAELDDRIAEMQRLRTHLVDLQQRAESIPEEAPSFCRLIEHVRVTESGGDAETPRDEARGEARGPV